MIATRRAPLRIRVEIADWGESFYELFALNVFGLGPYNRADAEFMLHRLAVRDRISLTPNLVQQLCQVTGGHPGLLRATFNAVVYHGWATRDDYIADQLLDDARVREECDKIWYSLDEDEQQTLTGIARGQSSSMQDTELVSYLDVKGLLDRREGGRRLVIAPRLFADYVRELHAR